MQCITLTLSTYLVLQQLSLFQTNTKPLKPIVKTLNSFVETFFSPDIFGLTSSFFLSCVSHYSSAYDDTSKQVLVPKRGKKKYQHFLYPVNHLNQRKSPSAPLVSKEIETDFFRRRFSRSREKFPKLRTLV